MAPTLCCEQIALVIVLYLILEVMAPTLCCEQVASVIVFYLILEVMPRPFAVSRLRRLMSSI